MPLFPPRRGRRRAVMPGCVAVALAVLAGCTSGSGGSASAGQEHGGEPLLGRIPVVVAGHGLKLPLDAYLVDDQRMRRLNQARADAIDRCTRDFGFRYRPPGPPRKETGPRSSTDRRYGITDATVAAQDGYGLGDRDPARQPPPERPSFSRQQETVVFGNGRTRVRGREVPEGGCAGQADAVLGLARPDGPDLDLPLRLSNDAFEASRKDSRTREVFARWSQCMAAAGYDYRDPLVPPGDPQLRDAPEKEAVRAALQDIACKKQTNLTGTWFAVETAYQKRTVDRNRAELESVRQTITNALRGTAGTHMPTGPAPD
ncbi:hypothetical protein [Streptomyces yaizuensis]|uniref:DUF2477 domain-containing protein n=1 Tax=Streptomyces yaizuensis TaxID=2989713 RepID=A0ABQ5PBC7_9ACTN|nr:hypothetical protein [Streptomyces sp. YSPA8]GLF99879.1 DUF2477 domain-containing protein [Streptomyces sp. YSPA8]